MKTKKDENIFNKDLNSIYWSDLSNLKDLEISFSSEDAIFKDGNARIPQISRKMTLEEILVTRGNR